jgi:hypothetical protein
LRKNSVLLKKLIVPVVVCAALLGGLADVGVAGAATPTPSVSTAKAQGQSHPLGRWLSSHRPQVRRAVLGIGAKSIGISRQELASDLRSGHSLADIAGAHGVSTQSVVTALANAADARVDKAETGHKLTAAQVAKIKSALKPLVVKLVNHHFEKKSARAPSDHT